jgi:ubiquinone/menaquinone biosynthesis C-methylase UbiE
VASCQPALLGYAEGDLNAITKHWWIPNRKRDKELIDSFNQPDDDFRNSFRDLELINRCLGGVAVVLRELERLLPSSLQPVSVLDVGTGAADIPRALIRWARHRGQALSVVALDANEMALSIAQSHRAERLRFILADGTALPFRDESFDFVLSSLTLHHFDDGPAVRVMGEMRRVARRGVIVNDLRRGYLPAALIWIVTRLTGMNRLTRHDGPLSVLRSRTVEEYRQLATQSGLVSAEVHKHPFWRAAIVARKPA